VKILGGEPTLHSDFKKIINLTLIYFSHVQIFTNGTVSEETKKFLLSKGSHISLVFNVATPGFMFNKKINNYVKSNIVSFFHKVKVTLCLTFNINSDIRTMLDAVGDEIIGQASSFRLGFSNPVAGEKNSCRFSQLPKMGEKVLFAVSRIRKINRSARLGLNCGFVRCMFSDHQFYLIKKQRVEYNGFGCFGKDASFDLQTDLSAFHCFPLSTKNRLSSIGKSFVKINRYFIEKRFRNWSRFTKNVCKKCPFYGFGAKKCPGPCIAFNYNERL